MKILHSYILKQLLKNLLLCVLALCLLFSVVDFFDRIDNIVGEGSKVSVVFTYFALKLPNILNLVLPIAMLVATLLTIGILSKNSEFTAMRASGSSVFWLTKPVILCGLALSIFSLLWGETVVPFSSRRVKEIYNIDIKKKDETGRYSQEYFWWRTGKKFFSVDFFDSRKSTLHDLAILEMNSEFKPIERIQADRAEWLGDGFGWSMKGVRQLTLEEKRLRKEEKYDSLPLPIRESPRDFFDVKQEPETMSFRELSSFITKQRNNGLDASEYLADLYAKISFPFVILIIPLVVLPFAIRPGRTGSLASSVLAAIAIGFSYYAVHSFSVAMGRAELWPPLLAAWMANLILGTVGVILNLGAEAPE
jgi:lipopolysaccharide export system permease protein